MMAADRSPNADPRPRDDLAPELRRAVQDVLDQSPPEDLMRRTLDGLRRRRPGTVRTNRRRHPLLSALAVAVCIAVLVLVGRYRNGGDGQNRPVPPKEITLQPTDSLPTVWAYHRASHDSPEALEKLLDEHAGRLLVTEPKSFSMGAFPGLALEML